MRMITYYLALALVLVAGLLATLVSGALHDGSDRHLMAGFFTAVLCVATQTLLILFMIVSGRVLKAAIQARALSAHFLQELNLFFARRSSYPLAILAAFAATAAAVLGYGRFIGLPPALHVLLGLVAIGLNAQALWHGIRTLRANQALLDRAAAELDRLDAAGVPPGSATGEPGWTFSRSARWLVFALSAWGPYLYWSLVVWRGDFRRVPALLWILTVPVSLLALGRAWRARAAQPPSASEPPPSPSGS